MDLITETIAAIRPPDEAAMNAAREHQDRLTKPRGALGALEEVSVRLAGIAGVCPPPMPEPAAVAVFAADHGVHAQGVTPWPQEVTAQMVHNFLAGGAVVNAFARQFGAEVRVVDIGVKADLPAADGLISRNVAHGTADLTVEPAMTDEQVRQAVEAGIEIARDLVAAGQPLPDHRRHGHRQHDRLGRADRRLHRPPGRDRHRVRHRHRRGHPRAQDRGRPYGPGAGPYELGDDPAPLAVLAHLGGLEHAALTGFILGAAAERVPVVLDGVIAGAAALAAAALAPDVTGACVAGHRSAEPGHAAALAHLELRPLVDLELRLGEGTGALLALPLVQAAVRVLHEVATFDSAGVADKA